MKGKHGTSAAARHAIEDRDSQLATYQRRVAALTAEVKELRDKLTDQARSHSKEVKRLRVERDEGLSPMVQVVQRENAALRDRTDRAERDLRTIRERRDREGARLIDHFVDSHGLTRVEAIEAMFPIFGDSSKTFRLNTVRSKDPVKVDAIQRARGERR